MLWVCLSRDRGQTPRTRRPPPSLPPAPHSMLAAHTPSLMLRGRNEKIIRKQAARIGNGSPTPHPAITHTHPTVMGAWGLEGPGSHRWRCNNDHSNESSRSHWGTFIVRHTLNTHRLKSTQLLHKAGSAIIPVLQEAATSRAGNSAEVTQQGCGRASIRMQVPPEDRRPVRTARQWEACGFGNPNVTSAMSSLCDLGDVTGLTF